MIRFFSTAIFIFALAAICRAQPTTVPAAKKPSPPVTSAMKSSPAYAELLLRRTEREAELEQLLLDYTEEYPNIKEIRFELDLLKKALDKIAAVSVAESGKLTLALGKLMLRKIELEVDWLSLKAQYNDEDAQVRRAKRKLEVFEKAIKEILP